MNSFLTATNQFKQKSPSPSKQVTGELNSQHAYKTPKLLL